MVDGDQLNVVVDPLFVEIAERNVKEFDIVPLFYDAEKAHAVPISNESLFEGLKRAHEYSNIGEISNMLTRLWNKDNPDRVAAALLTYVNNQRIDGAKTGVVHEYSMYPQIAKQIGRATGGKNGRMSYWFQFSANGRKDTPQNRKRKYAEPNNSTMNRICAAFDDIGNINLNYAGVEPFSWKMLLSEPCTDSYPEIPEMFCEMDNASLHSIIESQETSYFDKKILINNYNLMAQDIIDRMTEAFGPLEKSYPYVAKFLFGGEGKEKSAHKQMFWRVFGDIALKNLKENLATADTCPECGYRVPSWVNTHQCVKNQKGFYECTDCGKMCERTNSTQCRCEDCQEIHNRIQKKIRAQKRRSAAKELANELNKKKQQNLRNNVLQSGDST